MPANALPLRLSEPKPLKESKVRTFSVRAKWLCDGDCRLDASFHTDEILTAIRTIEKSGFPLKMLVSEDITQQIFWPSRFKRIYTDKPENGYPFLQASEVLMFRLVPKRWLARLKVPNSNNYYVNEGWILITRSGVIGRCILVCKRLTKFYLSDDLLRVIPLLPSGYLYAFLSTKIGQALLTKEQYGGTIVHLEPHHLHQIPVPLLPENEQLEIHDQIMKAYQLRDEANELLDRADGLLYKELGIPHFDESKVPYLFGSIKPKAFSVKSLEIGERFDVSFHIPIAKATVEQLRQGKYPLVQLGGVAKPYVAPRFRRIYVEPEYGMPFLQGSHIPLIKPHDLKYLSRRAHKELSPWIIREGWVLVTCSGTIGRIAIVPKFLDGWAASQHIERIIADPQHIHSGYIAAFLMTPYGQFQLMSKIYGGVVDELTEDDTANVCIPIPPIEIQHRIGTLVVQSFEKKEEANEIERNCITSLEERISKSK